MRLRQQTQLNDVPGPVEEENASSVGGGTATTSVNPHCKSDEVNICGQGQDTRKEGEAAWCLRNEAAGW